MKVKSLSRVRLSDPMDYSPPDSSVHGIFQARVLEWVATAFSNFNKMTVEEKGGKDAASETHDGGKKEGN